MTPRIARLSFFAAVILVAGGCSHTEAVTVQPSHPAIDTINERGARESAEVIMDGGHIAAARHLTISADSTKWVDAATGQLRSIPTADVQQVHFVERRRGTLQGLGLGLLIGGLAGMTAGYVTDEPGGFVSRTDATMVVGGIGGSLGVLVGLAAGLDGASRDIYRLHHRSEPDHP